MKQCSKCQRTRIIWKSQGREKYCVDCWNAIKVSASVKPTFKKHSSPRPRSLKRVKEDKEYSKLREIFLKKHPVCQAKLSAECSYNACDIHHTKGRGIHYLEVLTWISVCRHCHEVIHKENIKF